jgi:hypothetical protein
MWNTLNLTVIVLSFVATLGIFGYLLLDKSPTRLYGVSFLLFLSALFIIYGLTGWASLKFRLFCYLWGGVNFFLLIMVIFKHFLPDFNLTFIFWAVSTGFSFWTFLMLIDPIYLWFVSNPLVYELCYYVVTLIKLSEFHIQIIHLKQPLISAFLTYLSVILAFLAILFVEWLVYRSLKKKSSTKKGL